MIDATNSGFRHTRRVAWGDCDPARIAYSGRVPDFALEAIDAFWEHHLDGEGWFQLVLDRGIGTPFVHRRFERITMTLRGQGLRGPEGLPQVPSWVCAGRSVYLGASSRVLDCMIR